MLIVGQIWAAVLLLECQVQAGGLSGVIYDTFLHTKHYIIASLDFSILFCSQRLPSAPN